MGGLVCIDSLKVVGALNQEKVLIGDFSVLRDCETFADGSFAALCTRQPQGRMHADSMNTHFLFWSPFYTIYLESNIVGLITSIIACI